MIRFFWLGLFVAAFTLGCDKNDGGGGTTASTPDDDHRCSSNEVYSDYHPDRGFVYRDRDTGDIVNCDRSGDGFGGYGSTDQCYRWFPREERWRDRHGDWVDNHRCRRMPQFRYYPYDTYNPRNREYARYCYNRYGYGSTAVNYNGFWYCWVPHYGYGGYGSWGAQGGGWGGGFEFGFNCRQETSTHMDGALVFWYPTCDGY